MSCSRKRPKVGVQSALCLTLFRTSKQKVKYCKLENAWSTTWWKSIKILLKIIRCSGIWNEYFHFKLLRFKVQLCLRKMCGPIQFKALHKFVNTRNSTQIKTRKNENNTHFINFQKYECLALQYMKICASIAFKMSKVGHCNVYVLVFRAIHILMQYGGRVIGEKKDCKAIIAVARLESVDLTAQ